MILENNLVETMESIVVYDLFSEQLNLGNKKNFRIIC